MLEINLPLVNLHVDAIEPGQHTHIFARVNSGKTFNAIKIAFELALKLQPTNQHVLIVNVELDISSVIQRFDQVRRALKLDQIPSNIIFKHIAYGSTPNDILDIIKNYRGISMNISHAVIDDVGLMGIDSEEITEMNSEQRKLHVLTHLYKMSQEYAFAIVAFHQLSRSYSSDFNFKDYVNDYQDIVMKWCKSHKVDIKILHAPR